MWGRRTTLQTLQAPMRASSAGWLRGVPGYDVQPDNPKITAQQEEIAALNEQLDTIEWLGEQLGYALAVIAASPLILVLIGVFLAAIVALIILWGLLIPIILLLSPVFSESDTGNGAKGCLFVAAIALCIGEMWLIIANWWRIVAYWQQIVSLIAASWQWVVFAKFPLLTLWIGLSLMCVAGFLSNWRRNNRKRNERAEKYAQLEKLAEAEHERSIRQIERRYAKPNADIRASYGAVLDDIGRHYGV